MSDKPARRKTRNAMIQVWTTLNKELRNQVEDLERENAHLKKRLAEFESKEE